MKTSVILLFVIGTISFQHLEAQVVENPLLYYVQQIHSYAKPTDRVFEFEADFTTDKRKCIFITDRQSSLGPHGDYSWSVYYPQKTGGYLVVGYGLDAGIKGPTYIGYIEEIKRYGAITGGKYGISAQYLDQGAIKSQPIDAQMSHADAGHYPKYFADKFPDYHIKEFTLADLKQKYANPDPNKVIAPAEK